MMSALQELPRGLRMRLGGAHAPHIIWIDGRGRA